MPAAALLAASASSADPTVRDLVLLVDNATYVGPCPVTLTFTTAFDGEPGIVFGHRITGDGPARTRELFGYIDPSGSFSIGDQIEVDAAHAGTHVAQAVIRFGDTPGNPKLAGEVVSDKLTYSVTCSQPSPPPASPSPAPTTPATSR